MKNLKKITLLFFAFLFLAETKAQIFNEPLQKYANSVVDEFEQIPVKRKKTLYKISHNLYEEWKVKLIAQPLFVCTNNSRRSQTAQVWFAVASLYYGVPNLTSFSGGSKETAFNIRAVEALRRAGIQIKKTDSSNTENPVYTTTLMDKYQLDSYSKKCDDPKNPKTDFIAIMLCSDKDPSCPKVENANALFYLPFEDPRYEDHTASETKTYDNTCREIAREMLYVVSRMKARFVLDNEKKRK